MLILKWDNSFLHLHRFWKYKEMILVRNATVQVWTVGEGFGIGSEFRQTCCAADDFRDHEVLFRWSKCCSRSPSGFVITLGLTHGTLRTLAVSVRALFHFNFDSF